MVVSVTGIGDNDDILADWKRNKFIIAPEIEGISSKYLVVLTDIPFWADNADNLVEWCRTHSVKTKGMTVELETDEQLVMFELRWR